MDGEEVVEELRLMNSVGLLLREQGRLGEAEVVFRRGLKGFERVFGSEHPNTQTAAAWLKIITGA